MADIVESFIEIVCPSTGRHEKIWYRHLTGTTLIDCNGCDNCNGSATCLDCIRKVLKELKST